MLVSMEMTPTSQVPNRLQLRVTGRSEHETASNTSSLGLRDTGIASPSGIVRR